MTWTIDPSHTHLGFAVRHMMVSTVRGQFKNFSGNVTIDSSDFTKSSFEGEVEVASIDTGNPDRDNHLRTNDFFDAPAHPKITFRSTAIRAKGGDDYVVTGELSIRGVTKTVDFEVEFNGVGKNPWGKMVAGLSASTTISRKDFGMSYNAVLETGGMLIADKVKLELEVEATQEA